MVSGYLKILTEIKSHQYCIFIHRIVTNFLMKRMRGWIMFRLGRKQKFQGRSRLRWSHTIKLKALCVWICFEVFVLLFLHMTGKNPPPPIYFINLDCFLIEISDTCIKPHTNNISWRYECLVIFHGLKQNKEVIKWMHFGKFIPILLCHNADLFYLFYYSYFLTLICLWLVPDNTLNLWLIRHQPIF